MRRQACLSLCCILAPSLLPRAGRGQELIAGWEGDRLGGYAFASTLVSVGLGSHHALVLVGSGSYLYYSFPDSGGLTEVASPGVSAAVGYRLHTQRMSATLSAAYEVRRTWERPAVLPSTRRTGPGVAAEGELWLQATPLTVVDAIVSYSDANRYLWARSGLQRQLTNTLSLAHQLGGVPMTFKGIDVVSTIATFVKEYAVTLVLLGRTQRPWYARWFGQSVLDRLLQALPDVDVLVVCKD